jgi:ferric-dicitrate binding protein FerR (iron transport regulator)
LLRVLLIPLAVIATTAVGWAADWTVGPFTGEVTIVAQNGAATEPVVGQPVPSGATITTGTNARVLLISGDESMAVGPNTLMSLVTRGRSTTVFEERGEITFEINARNVRNFTVNSPVLAAVVKGTLFTVATTPEGTRVGVAHGSVLVRAEAGFQRVLIEAGEFATVMALYPRQIITSVEITENAAEAEPTEPALAVGTGQADGDNDEDEDSSGSSSSSSH